MKIWNEMITDCQIVTRRSRSISLEYFVWFESSDFGLKKWSDKPNRRSLDRIGNGYCPMFHKVRQSLHFVFNFLIFISLIRSFNFRVLAFFPCSRKTEFVFSKKLLTTTGKIRRLITTHDLRFYFSLLAFAIFPTARNIKIIYRSISNFLIIISLRLLSFL